VAIQKKQRVGKQVLDFADMKDQELLAEVEFSQQLQQQENQDESKPALKLVQDISTRWSSTHMMLKRYLILRDALDEQFDGEDDKMLTPQEWKELAGIADLLESCAEVVEMLEGDKYVTLSLVWFLVVVLNTILYDYVAESDGLEELRCNLHCQLERRFPAPSHIMMVSTMLHPLMKDLAFLVPYLPRSADGHAREMAKYKDAFIQGVFKANVELQSAVPVIQVNIDENDNSNDYKNSNKIINNINNSNTNQMSKVRQMMKSNQCQSVAEMENNDDTGRKRQADETLRKEIEHECARYLTAPLSSEDRDSQVDQFDILQWWSNNENKYPHIAKAARRYLCIPASSAPSERVFSNMNLTATKRRARMRTDLIEKLVFLKWNSKFLSSI
jgi:hypothetical protein